MKIYIEHTEDAGMEQTFETEKDFIQEVNETQIGLEIDKGLEPLYLSRANDLNEAIKIFKEYGYRIFKEV